MIEKLLSKTKKGAASFYMVAFSTLILIIIVTSFAAVIISEVTRTTNDDLSQSAYDSALAGVEDAKLVIYNYQKCIKDNDDRSWCNSVKQVVEDQNDCDGVGKILGRTRGGDEEGVPIQESSGAANNMSQFYTCVKINFPGNYISSINSSNSAKVIKTKFEDGVAEKVKKVKVSWFSADNSSSAGEANFQNFNNNKVEFGDKTSIPPTISVSMLQTPASFDVNTLTASSEGNTTNRGTLFLVPTSSVEAAKKTDAETYLAGYSATENQNHISENGFVKSNNRAATNKPYAVYCSFEGGKEYACSATIDLPNPTGGARNKDTFIFVVSLPYGKPQTTFALDFYCDVVCNTAVAEDDDASQEEKSTAMLDGVQVSIDSTGRANDMYRRVEVRLEGESDYPLSIMGPLELLKNGETPAELTKDMTVTSEYNFND